MPSQFLAEVFHLFEEMSEELQAVEIHLAAFTQVLGTAQAADGFIIELRANDAVLLILDERGGLDAGDLREHFQGVGFVHGSGARVEGGGGAEFLPKFALGVG